MKKRISPIIACSLTLVLMILAPTVSGQSYGWHTETFLVYFNLGVAVPTGQLADSCISGVHFGGGLGIVLSSESELSPELNVRYSYSRFGLKDTGAGPQPTNYQASTIVAHRGEGYLGLECRFRF